MIESTRDTFERRQGTLLHLNASALYLHPQHISFVGIQMGEYFAQQLSARFIWPSKPTERSSLFLITSTYSGAPFETSLSTLGQFGDSYRAGGWAFVIVWFLRLGAFSAWLYILGPYRGSFPGTVFYITILSQILRYDEQLPIILLQLLQFGIPIWFIINWVLFVPVQCETAVGMRAKEPSRLPAGREI